MACDEPEEINTLNDKDSLLSTHDLQALPKVSARRNRALLFAIALFVVLLCGTNLITISYLVDLKQNQSTFIPSRNNRFSSRATLFANKTISGGEVNKRYMVDSTYLY